MTKRITVQIIFFLAALLANSAAFSQHEDANWVFGRNAGIRFHPVTNQPTNFTSGADCSEASTSISDSSGNLLLYISTSDADPVNKLYTGIYNNKQQIIGNGDSINLFYSTNNGGVFLPFPGKRDTYCFFNVGYEPQINILNCSFNTCYSLFMTTIKKDALGEWIVTEKNKKVIKGNIEESIGVVKHGNGKDYWLFCHLLRDSLLRPGNGKVLRLLLTEKGIESLSYQEVGSPILGNIVPSGQYIVSSNGNKIAYPIYEDGKVDVFDFDRCTGDFYFNGTLNFGAGFYPYAGAFSVDGSLLYISCEHPTGNRKSYIYQYETTTLQATNLNIMHRYISHLKLAPDGRLYFPWTDGGGGNHYLGIVAEPDSLGPACGYVADGYYLGDSSNALNGLPNMPNYNLGPLPVYMADAGRDTFYCTGDSTIKAFRIGGDSIYGITYQWQPAPGIDTLTNRTQLVLPPPQSRWYYVTLTDTTYVGPSCNSRLDSVYIEVRNCTGITETATLQAKLYPNPTTGTLTIELPNVQGGSMALYNLLGQSVYQATLAGGQTTLALNLPPGLYLYRIGSGGKAVNGKLLVE